MIIDKITLYPIKIPFLIPFDHAKSSSAWSRNVIVEVSAENGSITGYGEAAPRRYVTGETTKDVIDTISRIVKSPFFPWKIESLKSIRLVANSLGEEKGNNAALCALETALLDAFARKKGVYLANILSPHQASRIYYGIPVPLTSSRKVREICTRAKQMDINRLKLKLGNDYRQNEKGLEAVEDVFRGKAVIKVDINGAWDEGTAKMHLPLFERFNVSVVEEPMAIGDPALLNYARRLREKGIKVMADESACTLYDLKKIVRDKSFDMINIRLSKCGGFFRSLKMIENIRRWGLAYQIGCHLGESGVLSAAGRVLSLLCPDALFHDGSYDTYILKKNVTTFDLGFGYRGAADALAGPGLGVTADKKNLASLMSRPVPLILKRN